MNFLLKLQANLARRFGRPAQAALLYRRALAAEPGSLRSLGRLGQCLAASGDKVGALEAFQQLVALAPQNGGAHYNIGFLLDEAGDAEGALAAFDRAVAAQPELDRAWFGRGLVLERRGQLREALASYQQAVLAEPMCHDGWYRAGCVHEALGELEDVEKIIHKLRGTHPQFAWKLMQQLEKTRSAGNPTEAD